MSLRPTEIGPVPEETGRVARAAFPKGNPYLQMRDVLGAVHDDAAFASLFAPRGRPAEAPWRLALVTVMQFAEGLSDRQAAEAARARIDWKFALGLQLSDPGFDLSVLCEFRARLVDGCAAQLLLEALLSACKAKGYLKARGRHRTDTTHVLGALRLVSRLELVAETLRQALSAIAAVAPEWLRGYAPADWFGRYGRRVEEYRLPKGREARQEYAQTVGVDGLKLLTDLYEPMAPRALRQPGEVQILRQVWLYQYVVIQGRVRLRDGQNLPPVAQQWDSPYETEARYSTKRGQSWIGYKVHLTETCDDDLPHLLTQVETTIAPVPDVVSLGSIQGGLAEAGLLPAQQLVDAGYARARNLIPSRTQHQIDLIGPTYADRQWQAKAGAGFDMAHFDVDWERRVATCPQGRQSIRWCVTETARR
ncbi:MAG: transposase, partial [Anaerolineae bacterium]